MKRILALAFVLAAVAGVAWARHGQKWHKQMFEHHITARIDEALDVAKATPQQRDAVYAARDRAMAALTAEHRSHQGDFKKVLDLFEADQLDRAEVKALRAAHEAAMQKDGVVITQALVEAHDALTPPQRKAVAEWARSHVRSGGPKIAGEWMKHRLAGHIEDALDAVNATDAQRTAIRAAVDHVFTTMEAGKAEHDAQVARALALFEADHVDPAELARLRETHVAARQKIGDAIAQAVEDAHDALTSAQREQLVAWVRSHHDGG
jgi:Spy/CpxP family protein refolding chaperone